MIKLLGSICILSGGTLLWRMQIMERRRQMETLEEFLSVLRRTAEEIRMTRTPLPGLWKNVSADCKTDAGRFLQKVAQAVERGDVLSEVWKTEAEELLVAPEARKHITNLGCELHGDEEKVCKAISLCIYELSRCYTKLQTERRLEEQRMTALCFSSAALLIILLI